MSNPNATLLPETPDRPIDACYVLVDSDWPASPRLIEYGGALNAEIRARRYVPVFRDAGATVYRLAACPSSK